MTTPAQGAQAEMCVDDAIPIDTSSIPIDFTSETLRMTQTHVGHGTGDGLRGTRSRHKDRVAIGSERISGAIELQPVGAELDWFLEKILGGSTDADPLPNTTDVAETVPAFQMMIDRVSKVFTYGDLRVSRAIFRGSSGQPINLSLELEGKTETVAAAGGFPALTHYITSIMIFPDCTLAFNSVQYEADMKSFELTIDNVLDTERFTNAITRSEIPAQDRIVTLRADFGYAGTAAAVYDYAIAGAALALLMTDGTNNYTFDFANAKIPAESPVVSGKTEIMHSVTFNCFRDASNSECKCTKSAVP